MDRSYVILHWMIAKEKLNENMSTFLLQRGIIGIIAYRKDAHISEKDRK